MYASTVAGWPPSHGTGISRTLISAQAVSWEDNSFLKMALRPSQDLGVGQSSRQERCFWKVSGVLLRVHFSKHASLGQEREKPEQGSWAKELSQRGKNLPQPLVEKARSRRVADFWVCLRQLVSFRFLCD